MRETGGGYTRARAYGRRAMAALAHGVAVLFCAAAVAVPARAQTASDGWVRVDDMLLAVRPDAVDTTGPAAVTTAFTPWNGGVVPIEFAANVTPEGRAAVFAACEVWTKRANVYCVPRGLDLTFLRVSRDGGGCYASLGANGLLVPARMNLDEGCWGRRTITHELGHVFGLAHEHQRPDRDTYVTIDTAAVDPTQLNAFALIAGAQTRGAYDFLSVMHYGDFAFASEPRRRTILPKAGFEWYAYSLGGSDFPSHGDGEALLGIYGGSVTYWPARPTSLRAIRNGPGETSITWSPPVGGPLVTQYELLVSAGSTYPDAHIVQARAVAPPATGATLSMAPGRYFATVKGTSADGEFARSTVLEFTVDSSPIAPPPDVPTLQATSAGGNRIALSWSRGRGGEPEMYTVYAGTIPGGDSLGSWPVGLATSTVVTAPLGATTYMRVVASNRYGASTSNEIGFYLAAPPSIVAPRLSVQAAANPVTVSWTAATNGASSYVLVVGTGPGTADVGVFPMGQARQITANAPLGVRLYVRVAAMSASGPLVSNEVDFLVPAPWQLPPPVMGPPAVNGRWVALAWYDATPRHYHLIARAGVGGPIVAVVPVGAVQSIAIPNVPSGTYWVTVAAAPGGAESNGVLVAVP